MRQLVGADPQILLTLYKSYIRSLIEYACFIYFPNDQKTIKKNRTNTIFCTTARKCQLSGRGVKRKLALSGREYRKIVYWPRPQKKKPSDRMFDCLGFFHLK